MGLTNGAVNLDPTLLLSPDAWRSVALPFVNHKRYVFAYAVSEKELTFQYASRAAEELGIELRYIDAYGARPVPHAQNCSNCSPDQFLSLIDSAELVVTSSFHGLCFSILFNKQFRYSLSSGKKESRLYNLALQFGLESYNVSNNDLSDLIDFSDANRKLEKLKAQSLEYLRRSLQRS